MRLLFFIDIQVVVEMLIYYRHESDFLAVGNAE